MKKFIMTSLVLALILVAGYYGVYHRGVYVDFDSESPVSVPFRAEGQQWMRQTPDGSYSPVVVRGVDVSASLPGHFGTEFFADEEDYLRWFENIGAMGANSVRVYLIMDDHFYNALYTYNTTHEQVLYLVQGLSVSDYANNNRFDSYGDDFYDKLVDDGKSVVDIIHGKKDISLSKLSGRGFYRKDISQWVLGYLVGSEWNSDTIAYTDNNTLRSRNHTGKYFSTTPDSTAFEAMLALIMDQITDYETKKYKTQRPIGFINDPAHDFLEYEPVYAKQLLKYAKLDAEHVLPTELMQAGTFAAYKLYDFCTDFTQYLSAVQTEELSPLLANLNREDSYEGYLALLAEYHNKPVIAAGYGFSSSRGAIQVDKEPLTEKEQGDQLADLSSELETKGWAGGFISTWQDTWERTTWNTAFSSLTERNYLWHDLQTESQGYGLMAFDPGETERVCLVDGEENEWTDEDFVIDYKGVGVSVKYDETGLYLLVRKTGLSQSDIFYLPLDVCPEMGSPSSLEPNLTFSRQADFILCLSGAENSRLLVQERYDATRQSFLSQISGINPFVEIPGKESPVFSPINMAMKNTLILDQITPEGRMQQRLKTWETGRLTHGNGDPQSVVYTSLADFCYGEDLIEIRLPWMLLNFYDPSLMQVHDDYYKHYGVEGISIKTMYLGVATSGESEMIPLSPVSLKGWGNNATYHERLKPSYYVLKKNWGS